MSNRTLCRIAPPPAAKRHRADGTRWLAAGKEPALAELMTDPLVGLLMRRDGVSPSELRSLVATAREKLRGRLCCRSAG